MFSFKDAIKKIQEYYPGFEEKELTNIDEWYDKEENREYYKTSFPKSYEAIMKNISITRKFINLYDGQGGEFAVGCYGSMRSWAFKVLDWMDSDGFYDEEAEAGDSVYLLPSKANINSVWWEPAELDKEQDFDKFCNQYHYYNCNLSETGKQITFYKKEN